jgi:predicted glycosyltransferase
VEDFERACEEHVENDKIIMMKIKEEKSKYVKDEEERKDKADMINRVNDRKHRIIVLETEKKNLQMKIKENNSLRYQMIIKNIDEDIRLLKKQL